jgi:hypothetical protein
MDESSFENKNYKNVDWDESSLAFDAPPIHEFGEKRPDQTPFGQDISFDQLIDNSFYDFGQGPQNPGFPSEAAAKGCPQFFVVFSQELFNTADSKSEQMSFNNDLFSQFVSHFQDRHPQSVCCHGFTGQFEQALRLADQFLGTKFRTAILNDPLIAGRDNLVVLAHSEEGDPQSPNLNVALVFKGEKDVFRSPSSSENPAVIFCQYLADLCTKIFLVQPEGVAVKEMGAGSIMNVARGRKPNRSIEKIDWEVTRVPTELMCEGTDQRELLLPQLRLCAGSEWSYVALPSAVTSFRNWGPRPVDSSLLYPGESPLSRLRRVENYLPEMLKKEVLERAAANPKQTVALLLKVPRLFQSFVDPAQMLKFEELVSAKQLELAQDVSRLKLAQRPNKQQIWEELKTILENHSHEFFDFGAFEAVQRSAPHVQALAAGKTISLDRLKDCIGKLCHVCDENGGVDAQVLSGLLAKFACQNTCKKTHEVRETLLPFAKFPQFANFLRNCHFDWDDQMAARIATLTERLHSLSQLKQEKRRAILEAVLDEALSLTPKESTESRSFKVQFWRLSSEKREGTVTAVLRDSERSVSFVVLNSDSRGQPYPQFKPEIENVLFTHEEGGLAVVRVNRESCQVFSFGLDERQNKGRLSLYPESVHFCLAIDQRKRRFALVELDKNAVTVGDLSDAGEMSNEVVFQVDIQQFLEELDVPVASCEPRKLVISPVFSAETERLHFTSVDGGLFVCDYRVNRVTRVATTVGEEFLSGVRAARNQVGFVLLGKSRVFLCDRALHIKKTLELPEECSRFALVQVERAEWLVGVAQSQLVCFQPHFTASPRGSDSDSGQPAEKGFDNPLMYYFALAKSKFGSKEFRISAPPRTEIVFVGPQNQHDLAAKIWAGLKIPGTPFHAVDPAADPEVALKKDSAQKFGVWQALVSSRVPSHIATFENGNLIPLNRGQTIGRHVSRCFGVDGVTAFLEMHKFIHFGVVEEVLQGFDGPVYCLGVIGEQSSAKSSFLNRMFETRFDVSAKRCTEGIWATHLLAEGVLYLIFDCEGLSSTHRSQKEDERLIVAMASFCDALFTTQGLNFKRGFHKMFPSQPDLLKSDKVFRGRLIFVVKDVLNEQHNQNQAAEALDEGIRQLLDRHSGNTFLDTYFQGLYDIFTLVFMETEKAPSNIRSIREEVHNLITDDRGTQTCLGMDGRWWSARILLDYLKLIFTQLYLGNLGFANLDENLQTLRLEGLKREAFEAWISGDFAFFGSAELKLAIHGKAVSLQHNEVNLRAAHPTLGDSEVSAKLQRWLRAKFEASVMRYSRASHQEFEDAFRGFSQAFKEDRANVLLKAHKARLEEIEEASPFKGFVSLQQEHFSQLVRDFFVSPSFCPRACHVCKLICSLEAFHPGKCDCRTDHLCGRPCQASQLCVAKGKTCGLFWGHSADKPHDCIEGMHTCLNYCSSDNCFRLCSHKNGHTQDTPHSCGEPHTCNSRCGQSQCPEKCVLPVETPHALHNCGRNRCPFPCQTCGDRCSSTNHFHNEEIRSSNPPSCHDCGKMHECRGLCEQPGFCFSKVTREDTVCKTARGCVPFSLVRCVFGKAACKTPVQAGEAPHSHVCDAPIHLCGALCPECQCPCIEPFGHEGLHRNPQHQNLTNKVYATVASSASFMLELRGKNVELSSGEQAVFDTCNKLCERLGRGHSHLFPCAKGEDCREGKGEHIRHVYHKVNSRAGAEFDHQLCRSFWRERGWTAPVAESDDNKFDRCGAKCKHYSHYSGETAPDKIFCRRQAFHAESQPHEFDCSREHKNRILKGMDIVFCVDITKSMGKWIKGVQNVVDAMIALAQKAEKMKFRFAFVGYRDHEPLGRDSFSDCEVEVQEFTDNTPQFKAFIEKVQESGGGDVPEAVLDGLWRCSKLRFGENTERFVYHIADAPPHGSEYGSADDFFPNGCPCGLSLPEVVEQFRRLGLRYRLIQAGSHLSKMADIFRGSFGLLYSQSYLDSDVALPKAITESIVTEWSKQGHPI